MAKQIVKKKIESKPPITKLARVMFEKQIKIEELVELSGVSKPLIISIKKGHAKNVNTDSLKKIASGLNVSVSDVWDM